MARRYVLAAADSVRRRREVVLVTGRNADMLALARQVRDNGKGLCL